MIQPNGEYLFICIFQTEKFCSSLAFLHLPKHITESFLPVKSILYGPKTHTLIFWWIDDSYICSCARRWTDGIFTLVFGGHHIYSQITSEKWILISFELFTIFSNTHFHIHVKKTLAWWSYFRVVNHLYLFSKTAFCIWCKELLVSLARWRVEK